MRLFSFLLIVSLVVNNHLPALSQQQPQWLTAEAIGANAGYVATSTIDKQGNFIMGGFFNQPMTIGSHPLTHIPSPGTNSIFIAKYDVAGNVPWAFKIGSEPGDTASTTTFNIDLETDTAGNIYLAGIVSGYLRIDGIVYDYFYDFGSFVCKISPTGNVLWVNRFMPINSPGVSQNGIRGIDVNPDGRVQGWGISDYAVLHSTSGTLSNSILNSECAYFFEFSTTGAVNWIKKLDSSTPTSPYNQMLVPNSMTYLPNGDYVIGGSYSLPQTLQSVALPAPYGPQDGNSFLARYNQNHQLLWVTTEVSRYDEGIRKVVTDSIGNIYAWLGCGDTAFIGNYVLPRPASTYRNEILAKYDGNGNVLWALQPNPNPNSNNNTIVNFSLDRKGYPIATGMLQGTQQFGNTTLSGNGAIDLYIVKYSPTGIPLWAQQSNATGTQSVLAENVLFDGQNSICLLGTCDNNTAFGSYSVSSSITGSKLFFAKLGNPTVTGTEETLTENQLYFYPNPVIQELELLLPTSFLNSSDNQVKLSVFDALGRTIYQRVTTASERMQVSLNNLPSGMYSLQVTGGSGSVTRQFMKISK